MTFKPIKDIRLSSLLDFLIESHFSYGQEIAITHLLISCNILLSDLQMNCHSSSQLIEFEVNLGAVCHYCHGRGRTVQQATSAD